MLNMHLLFLLFAELTDTGFKICFKIFSNTFNKLQLILFYLIRYVDFFYLINPGSNLGNPNANLNAN